MAIQFANNAYSTLASGITNSATSITLTTGEGARFPALTGSNYFLATLIDASNNLEIVKCTTRSTDVLTVVRAQESTTGRAYATGDRIELRITAGVLDALYDDTDTTYTAGDGLDLTSTAFSVDLKANGGVVIESTEMAVDLAASSITGTLAIGDGGTGLTAVGTAGQLLTTNSAANAAEWADAPQGVSNSKLFYFGSFT
jgi:hypothetical protein